MSQENVETVRRFWKARNEGDDDGVRAEIHPDTVWDLSRSRSPYAGTYQGFDDYRRVMREATEGWEDFRWEAEEFIDRVRPLPVKGRGARGAGAYRAS